MNNPVEKLQDQVEKRFNSLRGNVGTKKTIPPPPPRGPPTIVWFLAAAGVLTGYALYSKNERNRQKKERIKNLNRRTPPPTI